MGQKTHPVGYRLSVNKKWQSNWFAPKNKFSNDLEEDLKVRKYISHRMPNAGISKDMKRIEAARNAIGPNIDLLVDANCAFDLPTALSYAKEMENYNVYWFEEPLAIHDFKAHKTLNSSTKLTIATGENYYTLADFETLIENKGASMLNVDATICPGYDVALKVAKLAQKKGLKIAPHGCQELQLPLVAAVSNGELLEYYPPEVDELRKELFALSFSLCSRNVLCK